MGRPVEMFFRAVATPMKQEGVRVYGRPVWIGPFRDARKREGYKERFRDMMNLEYKALGIKDIEIIFSDFSSLPPTVRSVRHPNSFPCFVNGDDK